MNLLRLHRAHRGNVSVLFVFTALALFCAAAVVWNTGQTVASRIEVQTAADASAYCSSLWNTRAVNVVTGTNMVILRNASALAVSIDVVLTAGRILANWAAWAREVASGCGPHYGACHAAAWAYILASEGPAFADFASSALPEAIEGLGKFPRRLGELFEFERSWVEATPSLVEAQRVRLEAHHGCSIRVTSPGLEGRVEPPLRRGSAATILVPLALRFTLTDDGWPSDSSFRRIRIGDAVGEWDANGIAAVLAVAALVGDGHYVLPTAHGLLEAGPRTRQERRAFAVIAAARRRPVSRGRYVAPGVFDAPPAPGDAMVAYAQAETYNGIDGRLERFAPGGVGAIAPGYPFRMWTTWGWQWQSRLAIAEQLGAAIDADRQLTLWFGELGIDRATTDGWSALDEVGLH